MDYLCHYGIKGMKWKHKKGLAIAKIGANISTGKNGSSSVVGSKIGASIGAVNKTQTPSVNGQNTAKSIINNSLRNAIDLGKNILYKSITSINDVVNLGAFSSLFETKTKSIH